MYIRCDEQQHEPKEFFLYPADHIIRHPKSINVIGSNHSLFAPVLSNNSFLHNKKNLSLTLLLVSDISFTTNLPLVVQFLVHQIILDVLRAAQWLLWSPWFVCRDHQPCRKWSLAPFQPSWVILMDPPDVKNRSSHFCFYNKPTEIQVIVHRKNIFMMIVNVPCLVRFCAACNCHFLVPPCSSVWRHLYLCFCRDLLQIYPLGVPIQKNITNKLIKDVITTWKLFTKNWLNFTLDDIKRNLNSVPSLKLSFCPLL